MTFQQSPDGNSLPPPPDNPWMSRPRDPLGVLGPDEPGRNGFSIAGLVLGIVPVLGGILGIIFGLIGRSQTKTSGQKGRVMGTWGAALGAAWLVLIVLAVVAAPDDKPDRRDGAQSDSPGSSSSRQLRVGDCVATIPKDGAEVLGLDVVDCTLTHKGEVFATKRLDDPRYPGSDVLGDRAEKFCTTAFGPFVGRDFRKSSLDVYSVYPSVESWGRFDRVVTCLLTGKRLIGTAKGSGR